MGQREQNLRVLCASLKKISCLEIYKPMKDAGVVFIDPDTVYVSANTQNDVTIGRGSVILPNVYLLGKIKIGKNCVIWPNLILHNTTIKDHALLGRPNFSETNIGIGARIGYAVELRRTDVGDGSWVQHLAYIGDAKIGRNTEVGAGVITANYIGGEGKNGTVIHDGAFIGVGTVIVPPTTALTIGKEALTGAGSVIRKNIPPHAVVVGNDRILKDRTWHITKTGWKMRMKGTKKKKSASS